MRRKYVTEDAGAEMIRLASRAIGAATRLLAYLDANGEEWKRSFSEASEQAQCHLEPEPEPRNREP